MTTLAGVTMTFEASLLFSVTVTPPAGAGADSVTPKDADWPSFTGVLAGEMIVPVTVTMAVTVAGKFTTIADAVITADPGAIPVTGTVTVVAPGARLTVAGTVTLLGSSELRLTIKPAAGA
jgi:hypothetical protein